MGNIRIKMHRPIEGEIKTCTLRKNASGDWNVSFSCEVNVEPLPAKQEAIGIDVGLEHFATFPMDKRLPIPIFQTGRKRACKSTTKTAKIEKGTQERRKQGKVVAKIHERDQQSKKRLLPQRI